MILVHSLSSSNIARSILPCGCSEESVMIQSKAPVTTMYLDICKKRSFDPQRRDGRFCKSTQGINICYDWTRNKDGCNNEGCPKGMAHICEWCRQPHRSVDCPQVPGWKPGQDGGKKGKGRGKNSGRGKRRHM